MKFVNAAVLAVILAAPLASADGIQFECGPSKGQGYYADEGLFEGSGGWANDAIPSGVSVISFNLDTQAVEYRHKSATGVWKSHEQDNGKLELYSMSAQGSFQLLVTYPDTAGNVIEIVTITEIDPENGVATMLLTQTKNTELMTSAKILKSTCVLTPY